LRVGEPRNRQSRWADVLGGAAGGAFGQCAVTACRVACPKRQLAATTGECLIVSRAGDSLPSGRRNRAPNQRQESLNLKPQTGANVPNPIFPSWMLRAKASASRQRVDLIERPSLMRILNRSLSARVTLLDAPAGYGKTTLLSSWRQTLREDGHKVCWLSVDAQDNDPVQLLSYIAFAVHEGGLPFDVGADGPVPQISDLSEREILGRIVHSIAECPDRVVLMLDELETLAAGTVDRVIHPLLDYAPDNLHVAIASRGDNALRIARLETRGQAVRIGASQLAFTLADLTTMLARQCDRNTTRRLFDLTQGWPAAIQLIRSACDVGATIAHVLANPVKCASHLSSYLADEVLSGLGEETLDLLTAVSPVDQVEGELADQLCGRLDSHALLRSVKALDAFIQPGDSGAVTLRLHPLIREHLYARLAANAPARLRELHLRAADWFWRQGNLVEAVRHCMVAGDAAHATSLIVAAGGLKIWFLEGLTRLRAVMRLLSEEIVLRDQNLTLIHCLLEIKSGRVSRARQIFDSHIGAVQVSDPQNQSASPEEHIPDTLMMEIVLPIYEGKIVAPSVRRQIEEAIEHLTARQEVMRGQLLTLLCASAVQEGRYRDGRRLCEAALSAYDHSGGVYGASYIHLHLGSISFAQGDTEQAARLYRSGQHLARKHFNDDHGLRLICNLLQSELNYELNETQGVAPTARAAPQLIERGEGWFEIYASAYTTSAYHAFDEHGVDAALAVIDGGLAYARSNGLHTLENLLVLLRIELLTRAGRTSEARVQFDELRVEFVGWRQRDAAVDVSARLLLAEGKPAEALSLLEHSDAHAGPDYHVRTRIRHALLSAIAHHRQEASNRPIEYFDVAISLSAASGCVRSLLSEGAGLVPLLRDYIATSPAPANLAHALTILRLIEESSAPAAPDSLLSSAERKILQHLESGFSNKLIARKAGVTESTVRFHLRNIFVKLKVRSRLQAITIARQNNLLSA
jgi:LuxR family maltose regulon positive regulatory protein